jgi:putative hydrolase of the HAD superfamily
MTHAVLFDLDDTLYPEADFYRSGFAVAAGELERRGFGPAAATRAVLESIHFQQSRQGVFDAAAARLGFPAAWVPQLVDLFHEHSPCIRLPAASARVLARLRPWYRLGIVTDGHAEVQRKKIRALGVAPLVDAIVVADDLGREHWKPDPLPLLTCCRALDADPREAVFVGDNPPRDMLGARRAGMPGIRLRQGFFRDHDDAAWEKPWGEICGLEELEALLDRIAENV